MRSWCLACIAVALVLASAASQPVQLEEDACSVLQTSHSNAIPQQNREEVLNTALLQSERALSLQRHAEQRAQEELQLLRAKNALLTKELAAARADKSGRAGLLRAGDESMKATGVEAVLSQNTTNAPDASSTAGGLHLGSLLSRPDVNIIVKVMLCSLGIASALGLLLYLLGAVEIHPQVSKYSSWEEVENGKVTGFVLSVVMIPFHIIDDLKYIVVSLSTCSLQTWRNILVVSIIFGVGFYVMWQHGYIQPVLQQLACYVYVIAFIGSLVLVILLELWYQVRHNVKTPLQALNRVHKSAIRAEYYVGYISAEDRDKAIQEAEDSQLDTATEEARK